MSKDEAVEPLCNDSYIYSVSEWDVPCAMNWSDIQEETKSCVEKRSVIQTIFNLHAIRLIYFIQINVHSTILELNPFCIITKHFRNLNNYKIKLMQKGK